LASAESKADKSYFQELFKKLSICKQDLSDSAKNIHDTILSGERSFVPNDLTTSRVNSSQNSLGDYVDPSNFLVTTPTKVDRHPKTDYS
jgi:hypothetical protein